MLRSGHEAEKIFSSVEGSFAIVESIPAIAMDIETTLNNHGAREVLVVGTLTQAGAILEYPLLAAAIIDTRFASSSALVVATSLANRGVPILFISADPTFAGTGPLARITVLQKPYGERDLVEALASVLDLT